MRAFNKNRNYLSETPNITWDDSFIPPELYDDFEIEPENLEEEKASEKLEKQMSKEKAKVTQNNKGKTKEAAQNKDNTENLEKKWTLLVDNVPRHESNVNPMAGVQPAETVEKLDGHAVFPRFCGTTRDRQRKQRRSTKSLMTQRNTRLRDSERPIPRFTH